MSMRKDKAAKNLCVGDELMTENGEYMVVSSVIYMKFDDLYKVNTDLGSFKLQGDERVDIFS